MKEVLAELAMVENEITRLESQIKHLQDEVKHNKESNIHRKYKEFSHNQLPPNPNTLAKRLNEKVAFETKALHFISKAIKGDYNLTTNSEGGILREKLSKRNPQIKPPSPLREPRHPTPRVCTLHTT